RRCQSALEQAQLDDNHTWKCHKIAQVPANMQNLCGLRKEIGNPLHFGCRASIAFPQSSPTAGTAGYGLNPLFLRCIFSEWPLPGDGRKYNMTPGTAAVKRAGAQGGPADDAASSTHVDLVSTRGSVRERKRRPRPGRWNVCARVVAAQAGIDRSKLPAGS